MSAAEDLYGAPSGPARSSADELYGSGAPPSRRTASRGANSHAVREASAADALYGSAQSQPVGRGHDDGLRRIDLSPLGKALDVQRAGLQEALFHGGSSDENRARLRKSIGISSGYDDPRLFGSGPGSFGIDVPEWVSHLGRGVEDTALDTLTDPLTYETLGLGAAAKFGAEAFGAGARALPTPMRSAVAGLKNAADDKLTFGAAAKRAVGQAGVDTAIGASSKHLTRAELGEKVLRRQFDAIRTGLSDAQWADVLRVRNGEAPRAALSPIVEQRSAALKSFTDHLQKLRDGGAYREHYIPGIHDAEEVNPDRAARTFNTLDQPFDAHELQREQFAVDDTRLADHTKAFHGAIRSATRQQAGRDLTDELTKYFGGSIPHEVRSLFDVTTPAAGQMRSLGDYWRAGVAIPKAAVVGTSPRHMVNIADLLSQRSLSAIPEAAVNASRIMAKPAERGKILDRGIELGAISPTAERATPLIDWLGKLGVPGRIAAKPLHAMNDATWAFDDAAAQALARRHSARGMEGYAAGRQARRDLVDYQNVSPLTKALKNVMPFATFNSSTPGNVARAVVQNPARIEAMNRASGGTYTGGIYVTGDGRRVKLYNPTADIGRADPREFLRRTLADPIRFGVDYATTKPGRGEHYFEFGRDTHDPREAAKMLLEAVLAGVPGAREMLSQGGLGPFKPRSPFGDLLQGSTGLSVRSSK